MLDEKNSNIHIYAYQTMVYKSSGCVILTTSPQVLSLISASKEKYGDLITCPIMCLALGVLYEDLGGKLPSRLTDMYMSLIKHMIRKNLIKRGEPMCYDVLPDRYNKLLSVGVIFYEFVF